MENKTSKRSSAAVNVFFMRIVFQLPVLVIVESEVVDIGSCQLDGTLDVLTVQFSNSHPCVSFKCTVNCTNADKLFWIHAGMHQFIFNFM